MSPKPEPHRSAPPARRHLFRRLRGRPPLRASAAPHRDADGQHAVLQHDAQSAAAAHRPALLRAGDRMGPAADEFAVHARPDDRHPGLRHDGRHHHRQSRHDRREIPAPAVRGRHRACHHRGPRQARIEVAAGRRHRRIPSTAPTIRTTSWSPNATARSSCGCGRADADAKARADHALSSFRPRRRRHQSSTRRSRAAPTR